MFTLNDVKAEFSWLGLSPDAAKVQDQLFDRCINLVEDACRAAVYSTDADGYPTDFGVQKAWMAAVAYQLMAYNQLGPSNFVAGGAAYDPTTTTAVGIKSKSFAGTTITYDTAVTSTASSGSEAKIAAYQTSLCPEALNPLRRAGLLQELGGVR